jgi:hypothetical protein
MTRVNRQRKCGCWLCEESAETALRVAVLLRACEQMGSKLRSYSRRDWLDLQGSGYEAGLAWLSGAPSPSPANYVSSRPLP